MSSNEIRTRASNVTISSVTFSFPSKWKDILISYNAEKVLSTGYKTYHSSISIVPRTYYAGSMEFSELPISCGVKGSAIELPGKNLPTNEKDYVWELTRSLARHLWGVFPEKDRNLKWDERILTQFNQTTLSNQTNYCGGQSIVETILSQVSSDSSATRRRRGVPDEVSKTEINFMLEDEGLSTVNFIIEEKININKKFA